MARVAIFFEDIKSPEGKSGVQMGVMELDGVVDGTVTPAMKKAASIFKAMMAMERKNGSNIQGLSPEILSDLDADIARLATKRPELPRTSSTPLRRAPRGHRP